MRRRSAVVTFSAALCLAATACGGDGGEVDAIRATAAAQLTTTTTAAPPETTTSTTEDTTTTTVRPSTTTTTRPRTTTTTTPRPTTTVAASIPPTTRAPGDPRRAVAWERYAVSGDGRTLTFTYWSGPPPCSIDAGVDVEETPSAVRVTIFERDGSGGQPCIAIAQQKSATVNLATPLGSRRVLDGARS